MLTENRVLRLACFGFAGQLFWPIVSLASSLVGLLGVRGVFGLSTANLDGAFWAGVETALFGAFGFVF